MVLTVSVFADVSEDSGNFSKKSAAPDVRPPAEDPHAGLPLPFGFESGYFGKKFFAIPFKLLLAHTADQ